MIREAMEVWFAGMLETARPIPEPRHEGTSSGKFQLRVPAGLHAALAAEAERQQVSLSLFCATVLAGAAGFRAPRGNQRRQLARAAG